MGGRLPSVHVGIELYDSEVSYGEKGIRLLVPGSYNAYQRRTVICVGRTEKSKSEVIQLIRVLRSHWLAKDYRLIGRNCQTFVIEFCAKLGIPESCLPAEYL